MESNERLIVEKAGEGRDKAVMQGSRGGIGSGKKKLHGRAFYESIGSPKFVLAPMVDQSEFAWRMLSRSFIASDKQRDLLAYTPMLHARMFAETPKFRDAHFQPLRTSLLSAAPEASTPFLDGNPSDRPLFVQFCANNPEELLAAASYVSPFCDAVDLNLGCPQGIARKGKYGAFLQEDQELIYSLINRLHLNLDVPVTAKIRVLDTKEKTLEYAQKVLSAGASILTVHGRTREMKGHKTGLADWKMIRFLRDMLPKETVLFANGNILQKQDIARCLEETGADAVMSAEGNLYDPAIFADAPAVGEEGREYWRGLDGRAGWRMDAVMRRYMDIIYTHVLEVAPPVRQPLYLPSDPEAAAPSTPAPQTSTLAPVSGTEGTKRKAPEPQPEPGPAQHATEPPTKRSKANPDKKAKQKQGARREKPSSPNLLAMQPHLFKLLRPLVARHHNVRDALARSRAGDMEAFEHVLSLVEGVCQEGLKAYHQSGGASWAAELAAEATAQAEKIAETSRRIEEARHGAAERKPARGPEQMGGEDLGTETEMDESSVETVRACQRPWWVVQPYVRPLPKEALAKGSLTLSRKEREALRRTGDAFASEVAVCTEAEAEAEAETEGKGERPHGHVAIETLGEGKAEVEVPKQGLCCG
ncbi:tRNA-dihydrouridine synthase C [Diplocarpon rosae]|nr:tRNA-dihydrouridine synthase C [Diplocarpon rosae]